MRFLPILIPLWALCIAIPLAVEYDKRAARIWREKQKFIDAMRDLGIAFEEFGQMILVMASAFAKAGQAIEKMKGASNDGRAAVRSCTGL